MKRKSTHIRALEIDKVEITKLMRREKVRTYPHMIHKLLLFYQRRRKK